MTSPHSLDVESRPAVALVAALPASYGLKPAERLVLLALACDSFDGLTTAPGMDALAEWTGLFRGAAYDVVRALCQPTDRRPALLERDSTTRGRNRTVFRLLLHQPSDTPGRLAPSEPSDDPGRLEPVGPVDNSPQPSGEPSGQPSGEPSGNPGPHPSLPSQNPPTPHAPARVGAQSGWAGEECDARRPRGPHVLDAYGLSCTECLQRNADISDADRDAIYARGKLAELQRTRALPLDVDELVDRATRLGAGDLVAGVRAVDRATEQSLDGSRDPARVVRSRLDRAGATTPRPPTNRRERQAS